MYVNVTNTASKLQDKISAGKPESIHGWQSSRATVLPSLCPLSVVCPLTDYNVLCYHGPVVKVARG